MNKKNWTQALILIMVVGLIMSVVAGISISNSIAASTQKNYLFEDKGQANYHLLVLVEGAHQSYNDDFLRGLKAASNQYNIATEIIPISSQSYVADLHDLLDMAMYAQVDGVILHGVNVPELADKVQSLMIKGIPVIILNEDLPTSSRISYVGVNRYNIGQAAANALAETMNGEGKVAVIDQKTSKVPTSMSDDLMLLGMADVFKAYEGLSLELVEYTEAGLLSAETVATEIFRENPEVNGIFCTNGANTLGIAQVLIDNNLVNDYSLIGFGDESELLTYIEKGKIAQGTIITDYEDIGRAAVTTFYEYINQTFVSSYVNTALEVLGTDEAYDYIKAKEEDHEEK